MGITALLGAAGPTGNEPEAAKLAGD